MLLSILLASVVCLHFSVQRDEFLEHTNVECHLCTFWKINNCLF